MIKNTECRWDKDALDSMLQASGMDPLALLLVRDMCLISDDDGRAPLVTLATRFRNFFRKRAVEGKAELDATSKASLKIPGLAGGQSVEWWSAAITERVLPRAPRDWLRCEGCDVVWNSGLWTRWSSGFRKALRNAAEIKLIDYFEANVHGGW